MTRSSLRRSNSSRACILVAHVHSKQHCCCVVEPVLMYCLPISISADPNTLVSSMTTSSISCSTTDGASCSNSCSSLANNGAFCFCSSLCLALSYLATFLAALQTTLLSLPLSHSDQNGVLVASRGFSCHKTLLVCC